MWTSAAGAAAQAQAVDVVANNLANSDTAAFKKDMPTFREYLSTVEREHGAVDIPRGPIKDKDFYPLDGRDQAYVIEDGTYTNFKQGNLRVTQSPLDFAMDGPGFLEVSTPQGPRFTRQGSLHVGPDGLLVNNDGYAVLSAQPAGLAAAQAARTPAALVPPTARYINLRDRGPITVSPAGEIYAGEDLVARLSLTEFNDRNKLRKEGGQLFVNADPTNISTAPVRTQVRQGMIETSNVNPVEEMTNLIQANRLFEHDLKAMKTYNELLGREANDIGKL